MSKLKYKYVIVFITLYVLNAIFIDLERQY